MTSWLIPTLILIVVGYYVYIPLPEDAAEPWKQRIPALFLRIVDDTATIGTWLGFSRLGVIRGMLDGALQTAKKLESKIKGVESTDVSFDGINVRVYRPTSASKDDLLPGVVYIHGGGWAVLSVDDYDPFTRALSKMSNTVVVSVSYRLAPENVFPAAFDDCVKAVDYFIRNAAKFKVDASKIGVSGDSAGGNLAMAVSLYFGKEKSELPKLNFQALIYPALQAMDYNLTSYRDFDIPMRSTYTPVTKTSMIYYYNMYGFGGDHYMKYFIRNTHTSRETKQKYRKYVDPRNLDSKYKMQPNDDIPEENKEIAEKIAKVILNPYFAPLMATDEELKLLPKTYLITAEYDGLRDEGMILSQRLRRINHPLVFKHWSGIEHGFLVYSFYDSYWAGLEHMSSYIKDINSR